MSHRRFGSRPCSLRINHGGNVCVVMNGFDATRTVLTDYPFSNKDDEEAARHAWHTSEPSEWDKKYFETAMK